MLIVDHKCTQVSEQNRFRSAGDIPTAQASLRHSLHWILDRLCHINELAEKFVQHGPPRASSPNIDKSYIGHGTVHDGLMDIMKRRMDAESDDSNIFRDDDIIEPTSDAKLYTRRRSTATAMASIEDLPRLTGLHKDGHTSHGPDVSSRRHSIMNPPPALHRQLPSPPGPSLSSPRSLDFPSPSVASYAHSRIPPPLNFAPSSTLRQSTYLPPITAIPDAHQAHSATLQHEVSLQKIALSSLQDEHDRVLAAYTRSKLRAETLEKKQGSSESEIISLTEEKLRLQTQVIELERSVQELSRSRDEFREAAVKENAQYVIVVKNATRLGQLAEEEKESWKRTRTEMEQRIKGRTGQPDTAAAITTVVSVPSNETAPQMMLPLGVREPSVKIEAVSELPKSSPTATTPEATNTELKAELLRLRNRCAEVENALRRLRYESIKMEDIVDALGSARKSILEKANEVLGRTGEDSRSF